MIVSPEWLSSLFAWMIRASWQASVLIVLVLMVQVMLRSVLPAHWRCALWILVLVRLALPFSFESSSSIFNFLSLNSDRRQIPAKPPEIQGIAPFSTPLRTQPLSSPAARAKRPATALEVNSLRPVPASLHIPSWMTRIDLRSLTRTLPLLWLLGVFFLLVRLLWVNGKMASRMSGRRPVSDLALLQLASQCARTVGLRQTPWIVETEEVRSPALFGFSVPRLLLPQNLLTDFSLKELRYIFLHEFCHVRRWDIALNWLTAMLQILHWFNPLVWFASARIRSDRELACDAQVLFRLESSEGRDYGHTIIRLLEGFARPVRAPGLVGILEDRSQMKRRVRMISCFRPVAFRRRWIGLACAALLAIAALTDARTQIVRTKVDNTASPETLAVFRILDGETGSPIAGATLNRIQTSDADGRGEIRITYPGFVIVRASGYVARYVKIDEEESSERTLHMERAGTIGGVVRNEAGTPISNAEIQIIGPVMTVMTQSGQTTSMSNQAIGVTDAEGRFRYNEAPRNLEGLQLQLFHPDYAVTTYSAGVQSNRVVRNTVSMASLIAGEAELVMARGFSIAGVILDIRGRPIEGASVRMGFTGFPEGNRGKTSTDNNGRFVFQNVTAAETALEARAEGYVLQKKGIDLSPGMPEIRFTLHRGETLRVRVIDEAGKPVAGAMVTSGETGLQDQTNSEGRILWNSAPVQPFMIGVRARGFPDANEAVEAGERENVITLRNHREIRVTGKVIDAATRRPLPEFQVLVSTSRIAAVERWQDYRPAAEGKDGFFSLILRDSFRPTGTVVQADSHGERIVRYVVGLKIKAEGYLPDTSRTVAVENGDASLEVALERGRGVSGVVRLPGGEAASGAKVYLFGRFGVLMESPGRLTRLIEGPEILADQSGSFRFDPEPDARSLIAIHEMGFALLPIDGLGGPVTVSLAPWGRIEGNLHIGTRPGSNETVVLGSFFEPIQGSFRVAMRTQTDEEGRFVFGRVPAGVHRIARVQQTAERASGTFPIGRVEVSAGATSTINLGGNGRPITGRIVVASAREPVQWNQATGILESVTEISDDGRWYVAKFGPDGSFRIEDVPSGTYQLRLHILGIPDNGLTVKVVVPEIPGGRSDKPLDLGTIPLR